MNNVTALRLAVDGTASVVNLAAKGSTSEGIRENVGCHYFDVVCLGVAPNNQSGRIDMWIDDEGAINAEPTDMNFVANVLLDQLEVGVNGYIFGNVVFAQSDAEGETIGLESNVLETLQELTTKISESDLFAEFKRQAGES